MDAEIKTATSILSSAKGFDIIVNGVLRSFRPRREAAYRSARYLKAKYPGDIVEIRVRATDELISMRKDSRTR
jgi:hypothetical protein